MGLSDILKEAAKYNDEARKMAAFKVEQSAKNSVSISDKNLSNIYTTGENAKPGDNLSNTPLGNWYKQKPYTFEYGSTKDGTLKRFNLPISPSNINIVTHFATNVISTMYATVEEHSEQRYFDITISGTTGMSPRYFKESSKQIRDHKQEMSGRAGLPVKQKTQLSGVLGGFLKRGLSMIENAFNQGAELLKGDPKPTTGIDLQKTGYAAFHNFYKFLLVHKKLAARDRSLRGYNSNVKTLRFINYKDNNQYDVAIQGFQLTRSAADPMLYNYNITMRAYNLRTADKKEGSRDVADRAAELGLSGIENSVFSKVANKARKAKNAGYSAIAAARGFGS